MAVFDLKYHQYAERSILVSWSQEISGEILRDVLKFKSSIESSGIKQIVQVNSAYNSLLISYRFNIEHIHDEILILKELYAKEKISKTSLQKLWHVPVCYETHFGIDLESMSLAIGMSSEQIIEIHSDQIYTVYFLGFLPGFMYLGGLPETLHYQRKANPRTKVLKGAVAIGGEQTGVYPIGSPGGWNIIGNSPINFFDREKPSPCFVQAGDQIKFKRITLPEYHRIRKEVENGIFHVESEEIHG